MKQVNHTPRLLAVAIAATFASSAWAQTPPDAGQLLQEQRTAPVMPTPSPDFRIEAPMPGETPPGGAQVVVQRIALSGHSVFDEATLLEVLGEVADQSYDLAGLRALANRITLHYRNNGYPFARAFLPAQTASDGVIRIEILEGRYGTISSHGEDPVAARANDFLAPLAPGAVIESRLLERTTLILDDQPGIAISPVMRPGGEVGTGNLDVQVTKARELIGEVGADNYGNRNTGYHRARFNLQANSPFLFGDQLSLRTLYTDERMWLLSLSYGLPLGSSGLRGSISYAHTDYALARGFTGHGDAKVTSVGLSYPLLRSQPANLTLSANYQHKALYNNINNGADVSDYSSQSLPISLQFDRRDGFGGGGINFGSLTLTAGQMRLSDAMRTNPLRDDQHGDFAKLNLDVVRLQLLPNRFTFYARAAGQWANGNLDSSEGFSIAGANGVRAYPTGEASGDEGYLVQAELRYQHGALVPYLFYDTAAIRVNADGMGQPNPRIDLHGGGLGLRYQQQGFNLDLAAAWRGSEKAAAPHDKDDVRLWATVGYRF